MRMTISITFTDKITKEKIEEMAEEAREAFKIGIVTGDVEKVSVNVME